MRTKNSVAKGRLVAALLVWFLPSLSAAHQSSVVYSDIAVEGREVTLTLQVANADLYEALGLSQDRAATVQEVNASALRLAAYFLARVTVANHGHPCEGEAEAHSTLDKSGGFFFVQHLRYRCLRSLEDAEVTYGLFFDLDPRHQGLAHVRAFGSESEHVFRAQDRTLRLGRPLGVLDNVRDYLSLGVEHIFTGYDHLAFLFGLVIIAASLAVATGIPRAGEATKSPIRRGLGYVVRIVTAFTIAHSVTLCASALGWVALPSRFVESFIAVSIGYVALENILNPMPRHRFLLTFGFGLVHGFGFASVLKEIGLPKKGLLLSLLSFNIGVELGQLAVVALGFPVLFILARHSAQKDGDGEKRGEPYSALELGLVALLLLLGIALFLHENLPIKAVVGVTLGVPALLLVLVPKQGYDRAVRIGLSALIFALSLLWLVERALGQKLLSGVLG